MDELHMPNQGDGGKDGEYGQVTPDVRRLQMEDQKPASEAPQGVVFNKETADGLMTGARTVVEKAREDGQSPYTTLKEITGLVAAYRGGLPSDIPDSAVAMAKGGDDDNKEKSLSTAAIEKTNRDLDADRRLSGEGSKGS